MTAAAPTTAPTVARSELSGRATRTLHHRTEAGNLSETGMTLIGSISPGTPNANLGSQPPTGPGRIDNSPAAPADSVSRDRMPANLAEPRETNPLRRGDDRVDVSDLSKFLSKAQALPDVRQDLVARVRAEIESGGYESDERINGAIDSLIAEIEDGRIIDREG